MTLFFENVPLRIEHESTRGQPETARQAAEPDEEGLLAEAANHVARYKLPKAFVFVDTLVRSPAGKADYRWARSQAEAAGAG